MEKEIALVEAVFYLETEPLSVQNLSRITGFAPELVEQTIERLRGRLAGDASGVELVEIGGGFLLSPKKEYWELLKDRYGKKNEAKLSRAAMETLAIVAYSQPVTRGEIESIRGVQADNMIRLLAERNLIREVGKKDIPGKPVQFGTTREFLELFRLASIADLPKLDEAEADRFELATE